MEDQSPLYLDASPIIDLDRIIAALDAGMKKLPEKALREAREHRDVMVPRLIEVIRKASADARAGNVPKGNVHFFALFLLAEFHAKEAMPVILEAMSLPDDLPFELFGDAVTSVLARILALFAGDEPEMIDALIGDHSLNEYVRWEAAQVYLHLVRDGQMSRDEAVTRLHKHLRQAIKNNDEKIITPLINELNCYVPKEAFHDIEEAYHRGLVESFVITLEDVKQGIAEGESRVQEELDRCAPTGIEDTLEELRHWAAFQEEPRRPRTMPPPAPHSPPVLKHQEPAVASVESRSPRAGRNDPCPCGSGKKLKKCCGQRR